MVVTTALQDTCCCIVPGPLHPHTQCVRGRLHREATPASSRPPLLEHTQAAGAPVQGAQCNRRGPRGGAPGIFSEPTAGRQARSPNAGRAGGRGAPSGAATARQMASASRARARAGLFQVQGGWGGSSALGAAARTAALYSFRGRCGQKRPRGREQRPGRGARHARPEPRAPGGPQWRLGANWRKRHPGASRLGPTTGGARQPAGEGERRRGPTALKGALERPSTPPCRPVFSKNERRRRAGALPGGEPSIQGARPPGGAASGAAGVDGRCASAHGGRLLRA
jgi:hypothetical protein